LVVLLVAVPLVDNASAAPRVAITNHRVSHAPHAPRRAAPQALAVVFAAAIAAGLCVATTHVGTRRVPLSAAPNVVASRGPPH
jgi:hypothetical protein